MNLSIDRDKFRKNGRKFLWWTLAVCLVGWFIYYGICNITYSEGTRSGVLTKISRKGYVFKTYEGDLALSGVGGYMINPQNAGNVWSFSVRSRDVYEKLKNFEGRAVNLSYKEKLRTFPWLGETRYFVYDVEQLENPGIRY
jgi:hypothetical protein